NALFPVSLPAPVGERRFSYTVAAELPATDDPFNGPIKNIAPWNFHHPGRAHVCGHLSTFWSLSPVELISFLTNARGYFFLGRWACTLEGFAVTFFGIVALWSLAVLSFERFFVICRPLGNIRLQAKHAVLGLLYTVSKIGTTCEPDWYSTNMMDHSYIITFFATCFILPLGVIFFCYGKLLRKLRKVSHGRLATARKPERQVTRMVVVMIIAFMVGWTPYAVFSILVTAHPTIELDPRLASIPAFFSKTAAVYNPIIYVFMNKQLLEYHLVEEVIRYLSTTQQQTNGVWWRYTAMFLEMPTGFLSLVIKPR
uniref:Vertebrate ancient long opsin b n=1 Tax=Lates calcarifer TaxID=8187 RepID=A0A4W6EV15_LATCA